MVEILRDMGLTMDAAVKHIAIKLKMNSEEVHEIVKVFEGY